MTSEFKDGQYLEWCTDFPSYKVTRESPVFFLMGNEWSFRLILEYLPKTGSWYFNIYLDLKNKHRHLEPCQVKCQILFKKGETLSLHQTVLEVSHHYQVLSFTLGELYEKLQSYSVLGNSIKLLFFFEDVTGPILKLERKTGE